MLTDKSAELIDLRTLRNYTMLATALCSHHRHSGRSHTFDAVLVTEVLQLRLTPAIDDHVGERLVRRLGTCSGASGLVLHFQVRDPRVTANRGNKLVALYVPKSAPISREEIKDDLQ